MQERIILFDGVCNLCDASVQFILKRDEKDVFRFAALQSDKGKELTKARGISTPHLDSIILIVPGEAYYVKSDAALQIGRHLKGYAFVAKALLLIPSSIRDIVYDFVAKNRYKWYGKKTACLVPTAEMKAKFL